MPIDVRKTMALAELIAAVSEYEETIFMDDDDTDQIEALQLPIARAFLRFCDIPAHPMEMFDSVRGIVIDEPSARAAAASYQKSPIPLELRWRVFRRDNFTCKHCGVQAHLHADHVIPESRGGPTTMENLQTLCGDCNRKKGARE